MSGWFFVAMASLLVNGALVYERRILRASVLDNLRSALQWMEIHVSFRSRRPPRTFATYEQASQAHASIVKELMARLAEDES